MLLNENFTFTRPVTVTGAYLLPDRTIDGNFLPEEVFFHQMVLDRIDLSTNEYVIHNTSFAEGGPVLRIPKKDPYYCCDSNATMNAAGEYKLQGQNGEEWTLVHDMVGNLQPRTWYLLPTAYSITLVPEKTQQNVSPANQQVCFYISAIKFTVLKQNSSPTISTATESARAVEKTENFSTIADLEMQLSAAEELVNSLRQQINEQQDLIDHFLAVRKNLFLEL